MKNFNKYIRIFHRYMGVLIGIQLLFWVLGGLFFAWSNMDEIHGDTYRNPQKLMSANWNFISPTKAIRTIKNSNSVDSIQKIEVFELFNLPYYRIQYLSKGKTKTGLVNAQTGKLRNPLSQEEAIKLANMAFAPKANIESVEWLTKGMTGKHHEYRNRPLPAWAITYNHSSHTTIYVAANLAKIERFRNRNWRIFDFLWMMHTMDYQSRDKIANITLRIFSILALITVLSGFVYFYITSRYYINKKYNKK